MKKAVNILLLCFTDLSHDPRATKQIDALATSYNITTVSTGSSNCKEIEQEIIITEYRQNYISKVKHVTKLLLRAYSSIYWTNEFKKLVQTLLKKKFDLIICNELEPLPIANEVASNQNIPIYCDLHEYYLVDKLNGRFSHLQAKYEEWIFINHKNIVRAYSTVNKFIADIYFDQYGVNCEIINNASPYYDLSPVAAINNNIKLVNHGASIPQRRIEFMIDMMDFLDEKYTLDLYLMKNNSEYRNYLYQKAAFNPRVNVHDGIPFPEIPKILNKYDVGVYLIPPIHKNQQFALPNKIFQFIQARLAIAISPTLPMVQLLEKYHLGVVSQDFTPESLAKAIESMSVSHINTFKHNSHKAASIEHAEENKNQIKEIVDKLITNPHTPSE